VKNIFIALAVVAAIGGLVVYRSMSPSPKATNLADGTVIIDVRTTDEYASGHVQGAQNFPVEQMQDGKFPTISKDTPIALYCHSGRRAGIALEFMKKYGYKNVQSLGGVNDLARFNLSIASR
jgi:phage shock protein E